MDQELVLADRTVIAVVIAVGAFCIWLVVRIINRPEPKREKRRINWKRIVEHS